MSGSNRYGACVSLRVSHFLLSHDFRNSSIPKSKCNFRFAAHPEHNSERWAETELRLIVAETNELSSCYIAELKKSVLSGSKHVPERERTGSNDLMVPLVKLNHDSRQSGAVLAQNEHTCSADPV